MQSSSPSEDGGHRMRERSSSTVSTSSSRVLMVGSNFEVGVKIGGSKLRIGKNFNTNQPVFIKLEHLELEAPLLNKEHKLYRMIWLHKNTTVLPQVYYFGPYGKKNNAMAMELMGHSLEDLFDLCGRKFTLKTVLLIALQLKKNLNLLVKMVHSHNIIHCDVRSGNFLVDRSENNKEKMIHIIDFGLAKKYFDDVTRDKMPEQQSEMGTALSVASPPVTLSPQVVVPDENPLADDEVDWVLASMDLEFLLFRLPHLFPF
ncbi:casein kinase I-like [Daphnia pulicaria]|uniref:casein kinase I-like n=1 Tax=Daphnia pulicaria TaxID=35523 RepID=UPI001EEA9192|nr:casein kinase I-like [Daphnia pulicaria]